MALGNASGQLVFTRGIAHLIGFFQTKIHHKCNFLKKTRLCQKTQSSACLPLGSRRPVSCMYVSYSDLKRSSIIRSS